MNICLLIVSILSGLQPKTGPQNLLANPGFENGLSGWSTTGVGWRTGGGADARSGSSGAVCDVLKSQSTSETWRILSQKVVAKPGQVFSASAWSRTTALKRSRSFFEIHFLDSKGQVLSQFDSVAQSAESGYKELSFDTLPAPSGTDAIELRACVNVDKEPNGPSPEFHTWDDFDLHLLSVTEGDRSYLRSVAADTWRCIDSLTEPVHGLPYDSTSHGETTSTTNLGFYMVSVVAAREFGFLDEATTTTKLSRVVQVLKKLPKWHGFQSTWTNVNTLKSLIDSHEHVVSMLDAGNLAASLVVVSQSCPTLKQDCDGLLGAMDLAYFYDPMTKRLHGGFDVQTNAFVPNWWVTDLGSDSRFLSFFAVAKNVPVESWNHLDRSGSIGHNASILNPGWKGGGLFMQYIAGMFLNERNALAGVSARNFAYDQIAHKCDIHYPIWGWSACDSPRNGYTNGYGVAPLDQVIAPYASVLAIEDWGPAVVRNLRSMEARGIRDTTDHLGFFDGYDSLSQTHTKSFLVLDQSMILISLCNYLCGGRIRSLFGTSEWAQKGYSRIVDP